MTDVPVANKRIGSYRRHLKMTKTAVATALGLSGVRALNRVEEGRTKVDYPMLQAAMTLFGATLDDMTDPFRLEPGEGRWSFRVRGDEQPIGEDA